MKRFILAAMLLAAFPLVACAGDDVVRFKVRPMPAPQPALQYLLLPEVRELNPGNPAQWYMRCFAEQRNFFFNKGAVADRARYLSMPLSELAALKINRYGGGALTQVDWGARLDALDWQVLDSVQSDGLDFRQPELGPLRVLGTALKVRFRIEVAGGRFDEAVRTAKTMFALARHLGENATHSANRLGFFVARLALDELEEMVQQPNCPNLYWALTDLPTPLVDLRKGFQGERSLVAKELQSIREDGVMTAEELEKVVSRLSGVLGYARMKAGQSPHNLRAALTSRTKDGERVRAIRDRLLQTQRNAIADQLRSPQSTRAFFEDILALGYAKDLNQNYSPLQVILLEAKREFAILSDERLKLLGLNLWQIDKLRCQEKERSERGLFADLLPQVIEARREQGQLEQRIALLRHIEALRMYAAEHEKKLPAHLEDLEAPLPVDPFTGKPFDYRVEAAIAHLRSDPHQGGAQNAVNKVHYAVTVQK